MCTIFIDINLSKWYTWKKWITRRGLIRKSQFNEIRCEAGTVQDRLL